MLSGGKTIRSSCRFDKQRCYYDASRNGHFPPQSADALASIKHYIDEAISYTLCREAARHYMAEPEAAIVAA